MHVALYAVGFIIFQHDLQCLKIYGVIDRVLVITPFQISSNKLYLLIPIAYLHVKFV